MLVTDKLGMETKPAKALNYGYEAGDETLSEAALQQRIFMHHWNTYKSERRIKSFQSGVTTCVYDEFDSKEQLESMTYEQAKKHNITRDYTHIVRPDNNPDYVYTMILPAGTYVEEYDNEYRFVMSSEIKIKLIGTMGRVRITDEDLHPYECSVYGGKWINVFTKKF